MNVFDDQSVLLDRWFDMNRFDMNRFDNIIINRHIFMIEEFT